MTKQTIYSSNFRLTFAKAYKSSGQKSVPRFLSTSITYKDIKEDTARKWIREYDKGKLLETENGDKRMRIKTRKHENVEARLVQYIKFRRERVVHDKCGLSWNLLVTKAKQFAGQLNQTVLLDQTDGFRRC